MSVTTFQRSFAGGEISPGLAARADLQRYQEALRACRNFIVLAGGGVANRPGTHILGVQKDNGFVGLKPFRFPAADASFAIECGHGYFRFYRNGAVVRVSGVAAYSGGATYQVGDLVDEAGTIYYCRIDAPSSGPPSELSWWPLEGDIYEIPSPYAASAWTGTMRAQWHQHGTAVTITHLAYAPRELRFHSPTKWTLHTVLTAPDIAAPADVAIDAAVGTFPHSYQVTAIDGETYEESLPSAAVVTTAAKPTEEAPHTITWSSVDGAVGYNIYGDPFGNGTHGWLGSSTAALEFKDVGFVPDVAVTPPRPRELFTEELHYPHTSAIYQQRRIFAATHTNREQIFASRVGLPRNFCRSFPLRDDDALTFALESEEIQPVYYLIGLALGLVVLTNRGEWLLQGDEQGALLPTSIYPKQHGYVGTAEVAPVVIGESILFVQARGRTLRDLRFDEKVEGLSGRDLTLYARHLFKRGTTIVDMDYAHVPDSVVWCVRSDGVLLGLTYIKEEDVWGWHRHDTAGGEFEQVCVVPEANEDAVYVVVRRTVDDVVKRCIERFAPRDVSSRASGFFLDSGVSSTDEEVTELVGLDHLNGRQVYLLVDGNVQGPRTVTGGHVAVDPAGTIVHVGLRVTAELETLDLDVVGDRSIRATRKAVQGVTLLIEDSVRSFTVGPDASHLKGLTLRATEQEGLYEGPVELTATSQFGDKGRLLIRHTDPLPLTVLGVLPRVEVGG
jgi:hypothetical protein